VIRCRQILSADDDTGSISSSHWEKSLILCHPRMNRVPADPETGMVIARRACGDAPLERQKALCDSGYNWARFAQSAVLGRTPLRAF
jgi:hypothetical protein